MIEDVVAELVSAEDVTLVVLGIQRPVFAQLFRRQYQHPSVAQLVILDDRQRLKGFSQTH